MTTRAERRSRAGEQKLARSRTGVHRPPDNIPGHRQVLPLVDQHRPGAPQKFRRGGHRFTNCRILHKEGPRGTLRCRGALAHALGTLKGDGGRSCEQLVQLTVDGPGQVVLSSEGVRTHSAYATVSARPTLQFRGFYATVPACPGYDFFGEIEECPAHRRGHLARPKPALAASTARRLSEQRIGTISVAELLSASQQHYFGARTSFAQSSTDAPGPANEAPTSRRHFVRRSRTTGVGRMWNRPSVHFPIRGTPGTTTRPHGCAHNVKPTAGAPGSGATAARLDRAHRCSSRPSGRRSSRRIATPGNSTMGVRHLGRGDLAKPTASSLRPQLESRLPTPQRTCRTQFRCPNALVG